MNCTRNARLPLLGLALLSSAVLAAACSGGGGKREATPPAVLSTDPAGGTTEIDPSRYHATATFSEALDPQTADASSVTLRVAGRSIPIHAGVDPLVPETLFLEIQEQRPMALAASYEATVDTTVTDLEGDPLDAPFTWSWTTADGAWGTAEERIPLDGGRIESPQVAITGDGTVFAVWLFAGSVGGENEVWSMRRPAGEPWEAPQRLDLTTGRSIDLQLATNGPGGALVGWRERDPSTGDEYALWYTTYATAWSTAERVDGAETLPVLEYQMALLDDYTALAVWTRESVSGLGADLLGSRFEGIWEAAVPVGPAGGEAAQPVLLVATDGRGFVVWQDGGSTTRDVLFNEYRPGTGWVDASDTVTIATALDPDSVQLHAAALDLRSRLHVFYQRPIGGELHGLLRVRDVDGTWLNPARFDDPSAGNIQFVRAAGTADGVAVGWAEFPQGNINALDLWVNRIVDLSPGTAERLVGTAERPATFELLADPSGNALVVWKRAEPEHLLFAHRYVPSAGWGAPLGLGTASSFSQALGEDGRGLLAFTPFGTTSSMTLIPFE